MCQGYYRQNQGYIPNWKNIENFNGKFIHTEEWPNKLNYSNKKIDFFLKSYPAASGYLFISNKDFLISFIASGDGPNGFSLEASFI